MDSDFVIYDQNGNEQKNIYGKNMSIQNNQEKSSISTLEFEDALAMVAYPKYLKDFIKKFILDNYSNNDLANVYLIENSNKENIFVIEYCLVIEFNGKNYKVYVLVYLPILFPNYPPEFYIEKTSNIQLNKHYIDGKISPGDLKINLDFFVKYDPNKNNISEIIDNLVINFSQYFPIYKDNNNSSALNNLNKVNPNALCFLDKTRAYSVKIPKIQKSYSTNIQYVNNSKKLNDFQEIKLTKKSVFEIKGPFNDNTFLQYIKKQTKDIIGYNYLEYKEKFNIKGSLDNLKDLYKNVKKMDNNANINRKNEELKSQIKALKNIKIKLQEIEKGVEQEYKNYQSNTKTFFDKCDEIVTFPNPKDMEYLIKIKVMEDYLVYLKKAYEKKIVSFNDMINLTRSFSRQIFNMNYMRSKFKR